MKWYCSVKDCKIGGFWAHWWEWLGKRFDV